VFDHKYNKYIVVLDWVHI